MRRAIVLATVMLVAAGSMTPIAAAVDPPPDVHTYLEDPRKIAAKEK